MKWLFSYYLNSWMLLPQKLLLILLCLFNKELLSWVPKHLGLGTYFPIEQLLVVLMFCWVICWHLEPKREILFSLQHCSSSLYSQVFSEMFSFSARYLFLDLTRCLVILFLEWVDLSLSVKLRTSLSIRHLSGDSWVPNKNSLLDSRSKKLGTLLWTIVELLSFYIESLKLKSSLNSIRLIVCSCCCCLVVLAIDMLETILELDSLEPIFLLM